MPNLYELAENLPESAWRQLKRRPKYDPASELQGASRRAT